MVFEKKIIKFLLDNDATKHIFSYLKSEPTSFLNNLKVNLAGRCILLKALELDAELLQHEVISKLVVPFELNSCKIECISIKLNWKFQLQVLISGISIDVSITQRHGSEYEKMKKYLEEFKTEILRDDFMRRVCLHKTMEAIIASKYPYSCTDSKGTKKPLLWEFLVRALVDRLGVSVEQVDLTIRDTDYEGVWSGKRPMPDDQGYGFILGVHVNTLTLGCLVPKEARKKNPKIPKGGLVNTCIYVDNIRGFFEMNGEKCTTRQEYFHKFLFLDKLSITCPLRVGGISENFLISVAPTIGTQLSMHLSKAQYRYLIYAMVRIQLNVFVIRARGAEVYMNTDWKLFNARQRVEYILEDCTSCPELVRRRWKFVIAAAKVVSSDLTNELSDSFIRCRRAARREYLKLFHKVMEDLSLQSHAALLQMETKMHLEDIFSFRQYALLLWLKRFQACLRKQSSRLLNDFHDLVKSANFQLDQDFVAWKEKCPALISFFDDSTHEKVSNVKCYVSFPKLTLFVSENTKSKHRIKTVVEGTDIMVLVGLISNSIFVDTTIKNILCTRPEGVDTSRLMLRSLPKAEQFMYVKYHEDGSVSTAPRSLQLIMYPFEIFFSESDLRFFLATFVTILRKNIMSSFESSKQCLRRARCRAQELYEGFNWVETRTDRKVYIDAELINPKVCWGTETFPVDYYLWWKDAERDSRREPKKHSSLVVTYEMRTVSVKSIMHSNEIVSSHQTKKLWTKDPGQATGSQSTDTSWDSSLLRSDMLSVKLSGVTVEVDKISPYKRNVGLQLLNPLDISVIVNERELEYSLLKTNQISVIFSYIDLNLRVSLLSDIVALFGQFARAFGLITADLEITQQDYGKYLQNLNHFLKEHTTVSAAKGVSINVYSIHTQSTVKRVDFQSLVRYFKIEQAIYGSSSKRLDCQFQDVVLLLSESRLPRSAILLNPFDCRVQHTACVANREKPTTSLCNRPKTVTEIEIHPLIFTVARIHVQLILSLTESIAKQGKKADKSITESVVAQTRTIDDDSVYSPEDFVLLMPQKSSNEEVFLEDSKSGALVNVRQSNEDASVVLDFRNMIVFNSNSMGTNWNRISTTDDPPLFLSVKESRISGFSKTPKSLKLILKQYSNDQWRILGENRQRIALQHTSGLFARFDSGEGTLKKFPSFLKLKYHSLEAPIRETQKDNELKLISLNLRCPSVSLQLIPTKNIQYFKHENGQFFLRKDDTLKNFSPILVMCISPVQLDHNREVNAVSICKTSILITWTDHLAGSTLNFMNEMTLTLKATQYPFGLSSIDSDIREISLEVTEEMLRSVIGYRISILNAHRRMQIRSMVRYIWQGGSNHNFLDDENDEEEQMLLTGRSFFYIENSTEKKVTFIAGDKTFVLKSSQRKPLDIEKSTGNERIQYFSIDGFEDVSNCLFENGVSRAIVFGDQSRASGSKDGESASFGRDPSIRSKWSLRSPKPSVAPRPFSLDKKAQKLYVGWQVSEDALGGLIGTVRSPITVINEFKCYAFKFLVHYEDKRFFHGELKPGGFLHYGLSQEVVHSFQLKPMSSRYEFSPQVQPKQNTSRLFILRCPLVKHTEPGDKDDSAGFSSDFVLSVRIEVEFLRPCDQQPGYSGSYPFYKIFVSPMVEITNWVLIPLEVMLFQSELVNLEQITNRESTKDIEYFQLGYCQSAQVAHASLYKKLALSLREPEGTWSEILNFRVPTFMASLKIFESFVCVNLGVMRVEGVTNEKGILNINIDAPYQIFNRLDNLTIQVRNTTQNIKRAEKIGARMMPKYWVDDEVQFGLKKFQQKVNLNLPNNSAVSVGIAGENSSLVRLVTEIKVVHTVLVSGLSKQSRTVYLYPEFVISNETKYSIEVSDDFSSRLSAIKDSDKGNLTQRVRIGAGVCKEFHLKRSNKHKRIRISPDGFYWSGSIDLKEPISTGIAIYWRKNVRDDVSDSIGAFHDIHPAHLFGIDIVHKGNRQILMFLSKPRNGAHYKIKNHSRYDLSAFQYNFVSRKPTVYLPSNSTRDFAWSDAVKNRKEIMIVPVSLLKPKLNHLRVSHNAIIIEPDLFGIKKVQHRKRWKMGEVNLTIAVVPDGLVRVLHIRDDEFYAHGNDRRNLFPLRLSLRPSEHAILIKRDESTKLIFNVSVDLFKFSLKTQKTETDLLSVVINGISFVNTVREASCRRTLNICDVNIQNVMEGCKILNFDHDDMAGYALCGIISFLFPRTEKNPGSLYHYEDFSLEMRPFSLSLDTLFLHRLVKFIFRLLDLTNRTVQSEMLNAFEEIEYREQLSYYKALRVSDVNFNFEYKKLPIIEGPNERADIPPALRYVLNYLFSIAKRKITLNGILMNDVRFYGTELQDLFQNHYRSQVMGIVRNLIGGAISKKFEILLFPESQEVVDEISDEDSMDVEASFRELEETSSFFMNSQIITSSALGD